MTMTDRVTELCAFGDAFHAHLDVCWQCREHPFNLCETGHILLNAAGGTEGYAEKANALLAKGKAAK